MNTAKIQLEEFCNIDFPKTEIDIANYQAKVKKMLDDECAINSNLREHQTKVHQEIIKRNT